jgi:hypothetical protein
MLKTEKHSLSQKPIKPSIAAKKKVYPHPLAIV